MMYLLVIEAGEESGADGGVADLERGVMKSQCQMPRLPQNLEETLKTAG